MFRVRVTHECIVGLKNPTMGVKMEEVQQGKKVQIRTVVKCLTCYREVVVEMVLYGGAHVAVCSLCNGLAYNEPPKARES